MVNPQIHVPNSGTPRIPDQHRSVKVPSSQTTICSSSSQLIKMSHVRTKNHNLGGFPQPGSIHSWMVHHGKDHQQKWRMICLFGVIFHSDYLVGGLVAIFIFPHIGNNHPNWLIFFRGVAQPPTSYCWTISFLKVNNSSQFLRPPLWSTSPPGSKLQTMAMSWFCGCTVFSCIRNSWLLVG